MNFLKTKISFLLFVLFATSNLMPVNPKAHIVSFVQPRIASGWAAQYYTREQERQPIYIRIAFDKDADASFIKVFFNFLKRFDFLERINPVKIKKKIGLFNICVAPSVSREEVDAVLKQTNDHFDIEKQIRRERERKEKEDVEQRLKEEIEHEKIVRETAERRLLDEEISIPVAQADDRECIICYESVDKKGIDNFCITACCRQPICRDCTGNINTQCPYCRRSSFATEPMPQANQDTQDCDICLDTKSIQDFSLLECGHMFCTDCSTQLIDMAIQARSTEQLKCPDIHCAAPISEQDIRDITNNDREKIEAIATIRANEWIARQPNAKHCPTPDCSYVFINDEERLRLFTCPKCDKKYCSKCLVLHDIQMTCDAAKADSATIRETDQWKQTHTKPCPKCRTRIEKNGGCNHMQCKKCGTNFNWNTAKQ